MEDLVQMTESSIVPAFGEQGNVRLQEKVFMVEIPGLQDNSDGETLTSRRLVRVVFKGCHVTLEPPIFQDWADNDKMKDVTGANGSTGEGPMDKINNATSLFFFTYMVDVKRPREAVRDQNPKKFC